MIPTGLSEILDLLPFGHEMGNSSKISSLKKRVLGPAHTTPRGVGLMAWAIRRSVFSSHAIWPNYLNTLRLMAWKHAIWPDYLNTLRLMAWKHAIWPTFL